jgi:uncharacterized membrane protein
MSTARKVFGVIWVLAGALHFILPRTYEAIMPPYIPAHREMVMVSGAAEAAGGLMLLTPGLEKVARWWLLAVLVAIFPANVHMALHPGEIKGLPPVPEWTLWARLPFQAVFAALVIKLTEE